MIRFFAAGIPSTKGSARAFVRGGRAIVTNDAGAKAKVWAGIVSSAALDAMRGKAPIFELPLDVMVTFYLPRPKSHSTTRGLRPNAPTHSSSKPDADKLVRCALDALTGIVFGDDAQVARLVVEKRYANGAAGMAVSVEALGAEWREDKTRATEF